MSGIWVSGWRGLGIFWLAVLVVLGGTAGTLAMLGAPPVAPIAAPPTPAPATAVPSPARVAVAAPAQPLPLVSERRDIPAADRPGRDTPGPIADPDPALLEPLPGGAGDQLPRIALDGRMPMQVYAAGFDRSSRRPRVGILVAGIGLNEEESAKAVRDLPGAVTLAISPYATRLPKLLTAARLAEHEYLLSLPMEPQGFPLNDPGPHALLTRLSPDANMARLRWVLADIAGYVGLTNALGAMRGERFAGDATRMELVLAELAGRGLLWVDGRPEGMGGAAMQRQVWSRDVDLVLDEPLASIDAQLSRLEEIARDRGDALGLIGAPRTVAVDHVAAWANGLLNRGLALAPVSALVRPPAAVASSER